VWPMSRTGWWFGLSLEERTGGALWRAIFVERGGEL
jgi:hypothetical protein